MSINFCSTSTILISFALREERKRWRSNISDDEANMQQGKRLNTHLLKRTVQIEVIIKCFCICIALPNVGIIFIPLKAKIK